MPVHGWSTCHRKEVSRISEIQKRKWTSLIREVKWQRASGMDELIWYNASSRKKKHWMSRSLSAHPRRSVDRYGTKFSYSLLWKLVSTICQTIQSPNSVHTHDVKELLHSLINVLVSLCSFQRAGHVNSVEYTVHVIYDCKSSQFFTFKCQSMLC